MSAQRPPLRPYDASPSPEEASELGMEDDYSSTMDGGESTTTFSPSLQESWFRESHGHLVQSSNEVYQWPADDWHVHYEELWTEWKTTFLLSTEVEAGGDAGGSGRGLWPSQVSERIEERLSKPGAKFLDVGCGRKADWLCAMGDRFPLSEGIGIDTQPIVSEYLPPNVCGELYDCSQNLPYPDDFFEVITHAYLCPFLSQDWTYDRLLSEITRCLKPGGVYFCVDKHTTGLILESGRPASVEFPFTEAFLRLSSFWGTRESTSKLAQQGYRFRPVVLATEAFEFVEEEVIPAHFGIRRVDPLADRLGEIWFRLGLHVFAHGSWFLMQAGFSEEKSKTWEQECLREMEKLRDCEMGKGGFAQLHLVYALKKEEDV